MKQEYQSTLEYLQDYFMKMHFLIINDKRIMKVKLENRSMPEKDRIFHCNDLKRGIAKREKYQIKVNGEIKKILKREKKLQERLLV